MKRMLLCILAVLMTVSMLACTAEKEEKKPANDETSTNGEITDNAETDVDTTDDEEISDEGVINFDDLIAAAG